MRSRETKKLESENSKRINDALVAFSIKGCRFFYKRVPCQLPWHGSWKDAWSREGQYKMRDITHSSVNIY